MGADFILRRLLLAIPTLLGVAVIVFTLGIFSPGDPALAALGMTSEGRTSFDVAQVELARQKLGLDRPAYLRFALWLGGALTGDFGRSTAQPYNVAELIGQALPVTLALISATMLASIAIGIPLGLVSAVMRGRPADYASRLIAILGVSTPTFWLGLILLLVFAYWWPIFPINGSLASDGPKVLVLPVLAIATHPAALIARMTRSSMLEVLGEDYIRTALAKGLAKPRVVLRHALRNAISPVITVIGFQFGNLIGAAVAVEHIFSLPGLGTLMIQSIYAKDLLVIQAVALVISAVFVAANLAVDLLYAAIDPRLSG